MNVTFIQTADAVFYAPMLQQTSRTVRQFCMRHGFLYESYVGIKRGTMPWHATYNRIYMLKDMVDRGVQGWVFYLDADAYVADLDFDLRAYLADKGAYAGIFAGWVDPAIPYTINAGGFALNLSHGLGRQLVLDYWQAVEALPDDAFRRAVVWGRDIPEDQYLLFRLLERYHDELRWGEAFLFERVNEGYTNHGPFIRQALRATSPDFRTRMTAMREEIDGIMAGRRDARGDDGPGYYLRADHPRVHATPIARRSLGAICSTREAGLLSFGPYVTLRAGSFVARLFGEATPADGPVRIRSEVTSDDGRTMWSDRTRTLAAPLRGLLDEHRFTAPHDLERVELRVWVEAEQTVAVLAIQFRWCDRWVAEG